LDKIFIDGTGCILGRLASNVAKLSKMGKEVIVLNCEKIVLKGEKNMIINEYRDIYKRIGGRHKGPFWQRKADAFVRRAIRGMLEYKKTKGAKAYNHVKVYIGIPKEYTSVPKDNFMDFPEAKLKSGTSKFIYVKDLTKELGGRWL